MKKEHIGDGVYVGPFNGDPRGLTLTTSDGTRETNTIYLEEAVIRAFLAYLADNGLLPGQRK
jgi:hypothetical protein